MRGCADAVRVTIQDLSEKLQMATQMLTSTNNAGEIHEVCQVIAAIAEAIASLQKLL